MQSIRVNADYEISLFKGRPGPSVMNRSLEFLAFFLDDRPVLTDKVYAPDYLSYVESITGHRPQTVSKEPFINWWGPLTDLERERWLNSKLTSAELNLSQGWCKDLYIIRAAGDLDRVKWNKDYVCKSLFGMSGKGIKVVRSASEVTVPAVLEPLRNRTYDFSHYFFADGNSIAYQNFIDHQFQYRGTLFNDHYHPSVENLPFYNDVEGWEELKEALAKVLAHYNTRGLCVDSFVYEEQGVQRIRHMSEVNSRKTMGMVTYDLAKRFAEGRPWCMLVLGKGKARREEVPENVLLLSPEDVRFQMFFLSAKNQQEGRELMRELKRSLPDCEFAVEL